jgi:4-hydroxybenzoate polyprenyltransferase
MLYGNPGNIHVNLLTFSATVFLYGFHRIYRRNRLFDDEHKEERHHWVDERKDLYYVIVGAAFVLAAVQTVYMPLRVWILLVPTGLIAIGYSTPVIKTKNGFIRLRDILWLKVVWIGLAYAMLTTFLPILYKQPVSNILHPSVLFLFLENFIFIFVLCIPFDIRDMNYDKRNGINTLPVLLGIKNSIILSWLLLLLFVVVVYFHYLFGGLNIDMARILTISAIETGCFVTISKPERPNLFFPLAIESGMILQWLLIFSIV